MPKLMQWPDLLSRPRPHADARLSYGEDPSQIADLWLPKGHGPHPVVVLIHGGCWDAKIADLSIMDWAADDLRQRGLVVWNIEYRRLGQEGGGYPGTYRDVSAALNRLKAEAKVRGLASGPYVVAGHSAGGHLALWAAGRGSTTLPIKAVVDIAGIANLETDTDTACGTERTAAIAGPDRPERYVETSPTHRLPLGIPVVVIHGAEDTTVAPPIGDAYAKLARAAGDKVEVFNPPGGHVEEIAPGSEAWDVVASAIVRLTKAH